MEPKRLKDVIIPFPCPMKWNHMQELSEEVHFCDQCSKKVYDLSEASDKEFGKLQTETNGDFCARYDGSGIDLQGTIRAVDNNIALSRFLYALVLVFGTSLFSFSYASDLQTLNNIRKDVIHTHAATDTAIVYFKVFTSEDEIIDNRELMIYENGELFATGKIVNGYVEMVLPGKNTTYNFTFQVFGYESVNKNLKVKVKNGVADHGTTHRLHFKLLPPSNRRFTGSPAFL